MEGGDRIVSSSIDQRIVSMKFDNAQFESGAKQSIETLDKLKQSVDLGKSANGLKELGNAANSFSVSHIEQGLSSLGRGFSVLQIAAITAISNITTSLMNKLGNALSNTLGLIYSGGLRRATNLEQARFSMQGLLYDTDEAGKQILNYGITVEDIMGEKGPVQKAVKDTAFGLDEAAKAASNFIASGVTDLPELEMVLKSISGTAAQTGSSYDEIAHIYQRIAGNNRVYAIDLQSFAARGVNAAAALAKSLGKTEVEVRDMVSKGKIDLKIFSKAMYDAFGDNAFRANETYSGSLSNLKAALSRLGAKFESKKLENMRDIFNALRPTVDALSKALDPLIVMVTDLSTAVSQFAIGKIDKIREFFTSLSTEANKKFDLLEDFDRLTDGMSKAEKLDFKKQIEEGVRGPMGRLKQAFENTLESLKNFGSGFSSFFKQISENIKAFGSPFEGLDLTKGLESISEKLLSISNSFKDFIENSEFVKSAVMTIGIAFRALQTIVGIGIDTFKGFGSFLSSLKPIFSIVASSILGIVKTFSGFIGNVAELVKSSGVVTLFFERLSDIFREVGVVVSYLAIKLGLMGSSIDSSSPLANALNFIYTIFEKILDILVGLLSSTDGFKGWGVAITGALSKILDFLSPVGDGFESLKEKVSGFFKGLSSNSEGFSIFESLTALLEKAGNTITNIATKIWNGLSVIGEGIRNAFTGPNLTSAAGAVAIFGAGGIVYKIFQFVQGIAEGQGLKTLETIMRNLELASLKLIGVFRTMQESFQVKTIKEISTAILIFAAAIFVLSMIDPARLIAATAAITAAVVELVAAFSVLAALFTDRKASIPGESTGRKGMFQLATGLIALSTSILILSLAMKAVSSLTDDELKRGLSGMAAIFLMVITYVGAIEQISGKTGSIVKGSATLIGLAIAIDLLVIAVKKLGEMDVETLMRGITSVALLLTGLMIFTKFSSAEKMGFSSGAGLLLLATALLVLSNVVKTLGAMNPDQLTQGLAAIGFSLLAIAVFIKMLEETKPVTAAAGLLIAAAALAVIANAIGRLASFNSEALSVSLGMILIALGGITLALSILEHTSSIGTAVGLLLVATAVATLAEAFLVLALVPADKLATGLLAMLAGLVGIGAAAWLLEPVAGTMVVVAGAMLLFGVGVLALAAAIALLTPVMVAFSVALIGSLEVLLTGILTMRQQLMDGLIALLTALLDAIITIAPKIKEAFIVIIQALLEAFVELFTIIVEAVVQLLTVIATALVEAIPMLADAALQIIFGIMAVIMENVQEFVVLGMTIVTNFMNGIADALPDLINAAFNLVISFVEGLADAIDNNAERMGEAGWKLIKALVLGIGKAFKGFTKEPIQYIKELGSKAIAKLGEYFNISKALEVASRIITGIKNGIGGKISTVLTTVRDLGSKMIAKLKEFVSIEKLKKIGVDLINGLKNGITSAIKGAVDTVKNLGSKLLSGFKGVLGINSPSKKFEESGEDIVEGINSGLSDDSEPLSTIGQLANNLFSGFTSLFNRNKGEEAAKGLVNGLTIGMNSSAPANSAGAIVAGVTSQIANLSTGKMSPYGKNVPVGINAGMTGNTGPLYSSAGTVVGTILSKLNKKDEFENVGAEMMNGLIKGIKKKDPDVSKSAENVTFNAINRTKAIAKVSSPSRVFMEIGEYCMEGLAIGLGETGQVDKKVDSLRDILTNGLEDKLLGADDFNPTITPVLDLSGVQNGMGQIGGMFNKDYGILGSINGNIDSNQAIGIMDAINKLTDRLNQKIESELTSEDIYEAIRDGAANAQFRVLLNGRSIANAVNSENSDMLDARLGFI